MIKNILSTVGGVENYGIISICLFFAVFMAAAIYAFVQRKEFCDRMCALPLEDGLHEPKGASHEQ